MSFVTDLLFGPPPDPNPGLQASAAASEKVGLAQVDLGKQTLEWQKERAAATDALTGNLVKAQTDLANTQAQQSKDTYSRYQTNFAPLENTIAENAKNFDTEAERERYAGQASADVNNAFQNVEKQNIRSQARYGLRPNANALAAIDSQVRANQAAQTAGAMTAARYNARDTGYARQLQAVEVGKGLPVTATGEATGATQGFSNASNMNATANASYNAGLNTSLGFTNSGVNALGTAANGYNALNNYNANIYGMQSQQAASLLNFGGAMYGGSQGWFKADGGEIDTTNDNEPKGLVFGPGSTTSDSVPAMLSKGEYVIPADVVKAKGIQFFDKLLEKHHTPAEIQEARKEFISKQNFGLRRKAHG